MAMLVRKVELPRLQQMKMQSQDGKLASGHIYWDQASALVQIGKLDSAGLPIAVSRSRARFWTGRYRANRLMAREWQGSEGKPVWRAVSRCPRQLPPCPFVGYADVSDSYQYAPTRRRALGEMPACRTCRAIWL
jgi:hypothetical protein